MGAGKNTVYSISNTVSAKKLPIWTIESSLAFLIGLILLNNIYILGHVIGVPPGMVFVGLCVLGGLIGLRNISIAAVVYLLSNRFAAALVVLSVIFYILDQNAYGPTSVDQNGVIRVLCLAIFFTWIYSLGNRIDLQAFTHKLAVWSFFVAATFAVLHYSLMQIAPDLMTIAYDRIFADQYLDRISDRRVSGLFIDSNYFAASLSLFFFLLQRRRTINIGYFSLYLFCIYVSGSRLGLVLLVLISAHFFWRSNVVLRAALVMLVSFILLLTAILDVETGIENYEQSGGNENLAARMLDDKVVGQVQGSTNARITSLIDGVQFGARYNYLYGPGLMSFEARWQQWIDRYVPHNSIVTVFAQFGMFAIVPFWYLLRISLLAYREMGLTFVLVFWVPTMLLPFFLFYPVAFLFFFVPQALAGRAEISRRNDSVALNRSAV